MTPARFAKITTPFHKRYQYLHDVDDKGQLSRLVLCNGDLADSTHLIRIIQQVLPDEILPRCPVNVAVSFSVPE